MPFILFGVLGIYAVYLCVSRFVSRRAGVLAAVVAATSPLYALVSRQAMTDMAFVGPDDHGAGAGRAGAVRRRDDVRSRVARRASASASSTWPHHPLFYVAIGLFRGRAAAAGRRLAASSSWTFTRGGYRVTIPGVVVMLPYFAGFVASFVLVVARSLQGAALPQHRGDAVRARHAGQGDRRAGPARCWCSSRTSAFTWNWKRLPARSSAYGDPGRVARLRRGRRSPGTTRCWSATARRSGTSSTATTTGGAWCVGRHGDRGTFEYFLRELGYAILPWIALAPAALAAVVLTRRRARRSRRRGSADVAAAARPAAGDLLVRRDLVRRRPTRWCRCR